MVHAGNAFALSYRDQIVGHAVRHDRSSVNYREGHRFRAALFDFGGNLLAGAVPQTLAGLSVVVPPFMVLYQGWIGGIVSVDNSHRSRLCGVKSAAYYWVVLLLQWIPYSLAIGSGLRLGVATYRRNKGSRLSRYRLDKPALRDVMYCYVLVIPLFFIASCFEFLSTWNA